MTRSGFSIKYKLMLLLLLLPIISLTLYLSLAIHLFNSDKIAYVFESGAAVSKTLAAQTLAQVHESIGDIRPILIDYDPRQDRFATRGKQLFEDSNSLKWIGVFSMDSGGALSRKTELTKPGYGADLDQAMALAKRSCANGIALSPVKQTGATAKDGLIYLGTCHQDGQNAALPIVSLVSAPDLFESLRREGIYANYLIDPDGNQVIGPSADNPIDFSQWQIFRSMSQHDLPGGTFEDTLRSGEKVLASYAKVGIGQLKVVSLVNKASALSAARVLVSKSILFVIALVSLAAIIGVISSGKLTSTLLELDQATQKVALGDFDIRVRVRSKDEVGNLARGFNSMASELRSAYRKLDDYAKNLEKKVEERTAELHSLNTLLNGMLDSLGQGFLIFGRDRRCLPAYSKACEGIFSPKGGIAGRDVIELLRIAPDQTESYKQWVNALFDEKIPFSDLAELGPSHYNHPSGRHVTLQYRPLRSDDGRMDWVILIATDVTREREALLQAEADRARVEMILRLVESRRAFLSFVRETFNTLQQIESPEATQNLPDVLRGIHTIKGGAGTFFIRDVQATAHDLEEQIEGIQDSKQLSLALKAGCGKIRQELESFFNENQAIIGRGLGNFERSIELPVSEAHQFLAALEAAHPGTNLAERFSETFLQEPVSRHVAHLRGLIQDLARTQGKQIQPLALTGGDLKIDPDHYADLFQVLEHAIRNSIDHGLEAPTARKQGGKDETGKIAIRFSLENRLFTVEIEDDGKGIDPKKIRSKLQEFGKQTEAERESDEEVIQHVFDDGYSTKDGISMVSGRGIGMSAILAFARRLGGSARVTSKAGEWTRLWLGLPIKKV